MLNGQGVAAVILIAVKILIESINKLNISFTLFFGLILLSNRNMLKFWIQKNNVYF